MSKILRSATVLAVMHGSYTIQMADHFDDGTHAEGFREVLPSEVIEGVPAGQWPEGFHDVPAHYREDPRGQEANQ